MNPFQKPAFEGGELFTTKTPNASCLRNVKSKQLKAKCNFSPLSRYSFSLEYDSQNLNLKCKLAIDAVPHLLLLTSLASISINILLFLKNLTYLLT